MTSNVRTAALGLGWAALIAAMVFAPGCGEDESADGPRKDVVSGAAMDSINRVVTTSCKGIAADQQRRFSEFNHQCGFLDDCAASGQCSCGLGCGADVQMCNEALCKDVQAVCYCGDDCVDEPKKRPLCPEFFCKERGKFQADGCHKLDSCQFVDKAQDSKCQCTTMSDSAPTCWCGDTCEKSKLRCSAALCFGKDPASCLMVPGKPYDACYCATCGLKANKPACFLVHCP